MGTNNEVMALEVFSYTQSSDGSYIILKNGDFYLRCSGSEESAKNIIKLLTKEDSEA